MASEPPDTQLDDELSVNPEPSARRVFGRSCVAILAGVAVAGGLMVGCTALTVSESDRLNFGFGDWSRLGYELGCDAWQRARAEPDPARREAQTAFARDLLADLAHSDRSLSKALFTGPEAVDLWCATHA